ncbi:MAG TPA: rhomboid family intramembrane serine protease, partial [Segetibacter sp.]
MNEIRPGRFEILPVVIKNLLILNVLFFLAQKTIGATAMLNLDDVFGLHHVKSPLFQPWQLVTHLFLHGSFMHLFSNMFALWMFGSALETLWGPKRFLTFYFLCGIGAGLIQLASLWYQYHDLINTYVAIKNHPTREAIIEFYNLYGSSSQSCLNIAQNYLAEPDNNSAGAIQCISDQTNRLISYPTIGASGAVFGILAAFVYLFPNTYVYIYFLFPIKVKWIGLLYFGSEIVSAYKNNPTDNVAHWAHLGGG